MKENIFHSLHSHMKNMRFNQIKKVYPDYSPPVKIQPVSTKEFKAPREIDVLTNRLVKIIRTKELKKGIISHDDNNVKVLSRSENQNAFEDLMKELETTDSSSFKNNKLWNQLTLDEKKEKLVDYANRFNDRLDEKMVRSLGESLKSELDRKILEKNNLIKWSKKAEKIYEIKGLQIGENCFYWE